MLSLDFEAFEGKKFQFLGLLNFRLHYTMWVTSQKVYIFDEGCVLMKSNLLTGCWAGIICLFGFFFHF